jgi:asparagine synthase (glutamine-hydrolysing)
MLVVDGMIVLPDIYFEKVDRSTMASSVEARVPFLDAELVEFCMGLPAKVKIPFGRKKWLLKKAISGMLPDDILHQRKQGFTVPFGSWLQKSLKQLFNDHCERFRGSYRDVLNHNHINRLYMQMINGEKDNSFVLWKVLNFMIWANGRSMNF